MLPPTVSLMLKAPREGQVKTRLAREVGDHEATRVYRRLVEHQLRQIPAGWPVRIHFAPVDARAEMEAWLGAAYHYAPQPEGDLGERLSGAMHDHFANAPGPVIFLGGDCPYLTTARLLAVAEMLARTEAVLVPALDGGYCLLALSRPVERVFAAIPWSTDRVAEKTRERLRESAVEWSETEALEDVDDAAGWARAAGTCRPLAT
jgi:uncharacterized protein